MTAELRAGASTPPALASRSTGPGKRRISRLFIYLGAMLLGLWTMGPVLFAFWNSLIASPYSSGRFLANYLDLLSGTTASNNGGTDAGTQLLPAIGQSLLVASVLVVFNLLVGGIAAFGMSFYAFRGSQAFYLMVVATRVIPALAIIGPFFVAFRTVGILNTPWALMISYNVFTLPLTIMILRNYFDQLPRSIEEAAVIDGASRLRIVSIIIAPLAKPGLTACGVLIFLEAWSEFFYSLVLTNRLTVPPLLASFQSAEQFDWHGLAAATVVSLIPPITLAIMFQKNVVSSLVAGYTK